MANIAETQTLFKSAGCYFKVRPGKTDLKINLVQCVCGVTVHKKNAKRHTESIAHKRFIEVVAEQARNQHQINIPERTEQIAEPANLYED